MTGLKMLPRGSAASVNLEVYKMSEMIKKSIESLAIRLVTGLALAVERGVEHVITKSVERKMEELFSKGELTISNAEGALSQSLAENNIGVDANKIANSVRNVQADLALIVNVEGGGTGRILTNDSEEVIHGSQSISVKNGGIGEIVDGSKKTIISRGGPNPGLSVNVTNGGAGLVVRAWVDENGQTHGGISVTKIVE